MSRSLHVALAGLALSATAATVVTGCRGSSDCSEFSESARPLPPSRSGNAAGYSGSSSGATSANAGAAAARAISEADIVQLDDEQDRIYAMSKSGALAIVDAATPSKLTLMGKSSLPGQPFEMYRRGDVLLTMANATVAADGTRRVALAENDTPPELSGSESASLIAVDVKDPSTAKVGSALDLPGEIADSRIVGNILYIATYENGGCWGCKSGYRTVITSFDVSAPASPHQIDQLSFTTTAGDVGFNAAWATPWKRSIIATTTKLYVGGLAATTSDSTEWNGAQGQIAVVDISDPTGKLVASKTIPTAGPVMSRWQMDESNGVLRVVSQRGAGQTSNGSEFPVIETFDVGQSFARIGQLTMQLPRQEGLKTVRFDGPRGFAITFNQTDPLFTIDLSDPAKPIQKGELQIPGWMFYLEPHGDKLLGLGLDREDKNGNINVSLFDVADMSKPALVKRVSFGPSNLYEDYQITNTVIAEDQDRIQKSFRVDQDGLISVPFSGGQDTCSGTGGGVQLLDWSGSTLTKRGLAPMTGNPRRAIRRDSPSRRELIAVSDSDITAFTIDNRDAPAQLASVVIGTCVARNPYPGGLGGGFDEGGYYEGNDYQMGRDVANPNPMSICR